MRRIVIFLAAGFALAAAPAFAKPNRPDAPPSPAALLVHEIAIAHAFDAAFEIEDKEARAVVLQRISQAQVELGDLSGAAATIDMMPPGEVRDEAIFVLVEWYLREERFADAATFAAQASTVPLRSEAYRDSAEAAAGAGRFVEAEQLAARIELPDRVADLYTKIAERAAERGHAELAVDYLEQAERLARSLTDPEARARAFASMTDSAWALEEKDTTAAAIEAVKAAAPKIADTEVMALVLSKAAANQMSVAGIDAAVETLNLIPDFELREKEIAHAAEKHAQVGAFDEALSVVRRLSPAARGGAIGEIAAMLAREGARKEAEDLFAEAESVFPEIEDAEQRDELAHILVTHLSDAGMFEAADRLAQEIDDAFLRVRGLTEASKALLEGTGDIGKARELVAQAQRDASAIKPVHQQQRALLAVAEALAHAGMVKDAMTLANSMPDPQHRGLALAMLGEAVGRVERESIEDIDQIAYAEAARRALQAATLIHKDSERDAVLEALGKGQAEGNRIDEARQTLESVQSAHHRGSILAAIAKTQVDQENFEAALTSASQIRDAALSDRSFADIAEAQAREGYTLEASETAERIQAASLRAIVLGHIAEDTAAAGDTGSARTTLDAGLSLAGALVAQEEQAEAYVEIAQSQLKVEGVAAAQPTFDLAWQVAFAIVTPAERERALHLVGKVWAQSEDRDRAAKIAASLPAAWARSLVFSELAKEYRAVDRLEEANHALSQAIDAAHEVPDPSLRARILGKAAEAMVEVTGELEEAAAMADSATEPGGRDLILGMVAGAQSEGEEIAAALSTAEAITNPTERSLALLGVANAAADQGDRALALSIVSEVRQQGERPGGQDSAVARGLAESLAKADNMADALKLASSINSIAEKALAFGAIAEVLNRGGRGPGAHRASPAEGGKPGKS